MNLDDNCWKTPANSRGVGAGPGTNVAAGPMLEAKLMNLIGLVAEVLTQQ